MISFFRIKIRYLRITTNEKIDLLSDLFCSIFCKSKIQAEWKEQEDLVLLVTDKVLPRVEKVSLSLRLNDVKVGLIYKNSRNLNKLNYDFCVKYRSPFSAYRMVRRIKPAVVHVFSSWNFNAAFFLIKRKSKLAPIVFDDYDVWTGIVNQNYILNHYLPNQISRERFCLENADGLCCRSLELQIAKRQFNLKLRKVIFFTEYLLMNDYSANNFSESTKSNTIVYAGNLNTNIIRISESVRDIGWNIDVYPAHFSLKDFAYLPDNLHVHQSVDSSNLIHVLQQYKFGLIIPPDLAEGNELMYLPNKRDYAMTGKLFDYIDAGLKVLVKDYSFIMWLIDRMGSLIEMKGDNSLDAIRKTLLNIKESDIDSSKSTEYLKRYSLKYNGERLIRFYKEIRQ